MKVDKIKQLYQGKIIDEVKYGLEGTILKGNFERHKFGWTLKMQGNSYWCLNCYDTANSGFNHKMQGNS